MDESELQDRRRENLRAWTDARGGVAASLVGRPHVPPSYPSYLSQLLKDYSFGSRAARTCENRLGMPGQWLDQVHAEVAGQPASLSHLADARTLTLAESLPVVLEALGAIPALRWPAVQATLAQMVGQPEMRDDLAAELLPLLQPAAAKQRPAA